MRKTLLALAFGAILPLSSCDSSKKVDREWLTYTGTVAGYHVKIEQTKKAGLLETRGIDLDAISNNISPHQITGLDYRSDNELENINIMRAKNSGLFSIKLTGENYEVIPYFNFTQTNISPQEVKNAKDLIKKAVSEVYKEKNRLR